MSKIINLTPHPITLLGENGDVLVTLPKCENAPRCSQTTRVIGSVDGVTLTETSFGDVSGLPEEINGVRLIVSRLVLTACPSRKDLVVPNELVRDSNGIIIGCKSLAVN